MVHGYIVLLNSADICSRHKDHHICYVHPAWYCLCENYRP